MMKPAIWINHSSKWKKSPAKKWRLWGKKVEKPEMKSSVSQTQSTKKPINQAEEKILKMYDKYHSET